MKNIILIVLLLWSGVGVWVCGSVAPGTEAEAETGKSPVRMRSGGGEEWKVACRGGSGNRAGGSARCGK